MYKDVIIKLHIYLFFLFLIQMKSFSSNVTYLTCRNIENDSIHTFKIFHDYKVVNILPNGYEFDYLIEDESSNKIKSYFYQKRKDYVKKFILLFNLEDNILYDEMYEGSDINNLKLKDKKTYTCKR